MKTVHHKSMGHRLIHDGDEFYIAWVYYDVYDEYDEDYVIASVGKPITLTSDGMEEVIWDIAGAETALTMPIVKKVDGKWCERMNTVEVDPLFIRVTFPLLMTILVSAPTFIIGYGGWWLSGAIVEAVHGIESWLV